jgi:LacI family transcriptional regulator
MAEVASMGYPLVIIDYSPEDILRLVGKGRISVINSMDDKGTREIIKYLLDLGHKDIGILAGRDNTYSGRVRYKAYKEILAENGIEPRIEWDLKGEFIKKIAEQAVIDLIKTGNLPTALFCCNDDMAISAMDVLSRENIKVPDDISIVGFDDIMPASLVKPALTTVRVPIYDIAKKAVELVLEMIEDTARNISTYTLETRLVIRDSCKKHG